MGQRCRLAWGYRMTCHDTAGAVEPTGSVAKTHPDGLHASMTAGELAFFARFGRAREVAAGQVLFERGVVGTQMFIVISGQIDLDFGEDLMLKHLGRRILRRAGSADRRSCAQRRCQRFDRQPPDRVDP